MLRFGQYCRQCCGHTQSTEFEIEVQKNVTAPGHDPEPAALLTCTRCWGVTTSVDFPRFLWIQIDFHRLFRSHTHVKPENIIFSCQEGIQQAPSLVCHL